MSRIKRMVPHSMAVAAVLLMTSVARADTFDLTVDGSDAIWLAGRTDLVIPAANLAWPGGLIRHVGATPEEILETLPPGLVVTAGDVVRVLDPASGGISFFNGFGGPIYGPEGNGTPGSSSVGSFGGISGYLGTQGALAGVFLDASAPSAGPAPATLDFSNGGLGTDFLTLSPGLGQIFYIGNGLGAGNVFQEFTAPTGATRVFFGITDAFGFNGAPGAFDDNDGQYRIRVGVNQIPAPIPEPATLALLACGLGLLALRRRKRA